MDADLAVELIAEHREVLDRLTAEHHQLLADVASVLNECLEEGGTVFWAGNGGSAADAQHLAAELVGRFEIERSALRSVALTTDTSALSAIANDYGYEEVFARQLRGLARPNDVFIGMSTSGNSVNVLRAVEAAKALGLTVIGLTGEGGGKLANFADHCLRAPSAVTARVQEIHILWGHILCTYIDARRKDLGDV